MPISWRLRSRARRPGGSSAGRAVVAVGRAVVAVGRTARRSRRSVGARGARTGAGSWLWLDRALGETSSRADTLLAAVQADAQGPTVVVFVEHPDKLAGA